MSISQPATSEDAVVRALAVSPLVQLLVDLSGSMRAASPAAVEALGVPPAGPGTLVSSLVAAEPARYILELVSHACAANRTVTFDDLMWQPLPGEPTRLSGGVVPVRTGSGEAAAAVVTIDPSDFIALREHNAALRRDNSELRSIAEELRTRTDELNVVAVFLQSVLTSLRGAVIVMDTATNIRVWNAEAERIWGVPRRVAMRSRLQELDLGCIPGILEPGIEAALRGQASDHFDVSVQRQDGRSGEYLVTVTPLLGPGASVHGVTLLFAETQPT